MREFVKTMRGLSDPNRAKIIKLLQRRELCACHIKEILGLAQSTTSVHLKLLEEAGLICSSREGLRVRYRLADETANRYAACMLGSLWHWLEKDAEVTTVVARLPEGRQQSEQTPLSNQRTSV
jgi:ArsR family transcriptional regulator